MTQTVCRAAGEVYAVTAACEPLDVPTYAVFPNSASTLRPVSRRATWIRSSDVARQFSAAPRQQAVSPIKLQATAVSPVKVQAAPYGGTSAVESATKTEKKHKKLKKDKRGREDRPAAQEKSPTEPAPSVPDGDKSAQVESSPLHSTLHASRVPAWLSSGPASTGCDQSHVALTFIMTLLFAVYRRRRSGRRRRGLTVPSDETNKFQARRTAMRSNRVQRCNRTFACQPSQVFPSCWKMCIQCILSDGFVSGSNAAVRSDHASGLGCRVIAVKTSCPISRRSQGSQQRWCQ